MNAGFYNYGMAEEGYHRVFLSVTLIDFVFKMAKNYCPHVVFEDCKNIFKEKKIRSYINEGLEIYPDDSDNSILRVYLMIKKMHQMMRE